MKFEVNGKCFFSINDALCHAATILYISPKDKMYGAAQLRKGNNVSIAYGFKTVYIEVLK